MSGARRSGTVRLFAVLAVLPLASTPAGASSLPRANLGSLTSGTVYAVAVAGQRLIVGGDFTEVTPSANCVAPCARKNIAAFDLGTGDVIDSWYPDADLPVRAMVLAADGKTLYVGGEFTAFARGAPGGTPVLRSRIAALDVTATAAAGVVRAWDPAITGASVYALVLALDGKTVYAGGDFTMVGALSRANLAGIGSAAATATPWMPEADAAVRALALSADGVRVYAGGDFTIVGGAARARIAALSAASGAALAWNPGANASVRALRLAADQTKLYAGGLFNTGISSPSIGGAARDYIAALDATAGAATGWNPGANAAVHALRLSADQSKLYAGGDFTAIGGQARNRLAALDLTTGGATPWDPGSLGSTATVVEVLALSSAETLYAGGAFTQLGGAAVNGIAAFNVAPPVTSATPAGTVDVVSFSVALACTDNTGAPACTATRYTSDGTTPDGTSTAYSGAIPISAARTELKFFSTDGEWNTEAVKTEVYFIDTAPPQTAIAAGSIRGGTATPYGAATLKPIEFVCADGADGSGCQATYYTTDGSAPTPASTRYTGPFSLSDLAGVVVVNFFSVDAAGNAEPYKTEVYQVDLGAPRTTASPPGGAYAAAQTVTLSCDDGGGFGCAAVYYTRDGTQPSDGNEYTANGVRIPASTLYTGPLTVASGTILTVLAVDKAGNRRTELAGIYAFADAKGERRAGAGGLDPALLIGLAALALWRRAARQWRKWRIPVNTMAMPCSSAAAMTSRSRCEPPG